MIAVAVENVSVSEGREGKVRLTDELASAAERDGCNGRHAMI